MGGSNQGSIIENKEAMHQLRGAGSQQILPDAESKSSESSFISGKTHRNRMYFN